MFHFITFCHTNGAKPIDFLRSLSFPKASFWIKFSLAFQTVISQ